MNAVFKDLYFLYRFMTVKATFCKTKCDSFHSFIIEMTLPQSACIAHKHAQHKHHSDSSAKTAPAGKPVRC